MEDQGLGRQKRGRNQQASPYYYYDQCSPSTSSKRGNKRVHNSAGAKGRKSGRKDDPTSNVSASWYVGYAEDEESVDAIMKKFEELDKLKAEVQKKKREGAAVEPSTSLSTVSMETSTSLDSNKSSCSGVGTSSDAMVDQFIWPQEDQELTQDQLEELFKRTSSFTVKSALFNVDTDGFDDLDLLKMEFGYFDDDDGWVDEEADDYQVVDDDFWDHEFESEFANKTNPGIKRTRSDPSRKERRKLSNVEARRDLINRYKLMQVSMQDRNGNYFVMKKRVCTNDPSLPTYVRIPANPIPRSWARQIHTLQKVTDDNNAPGARYFEIPNMLDHDAKLTWYMRKKSECVLYRMKTADDITSGSHLMEILGRKYQVIYMNPPFLLPNESPQAGKISMEQFAELPIPDLISIGFLFIWTEKELIPHVLKVGEKWGFKYVENFCWIKKLVNNKIARQSSTYFNKSKTTCLILRCEGNIDIRHQRSPDCEFDFIKPSLPGQLCEEKPEFMYELIETLLPHAIYNPDTCPDGDRMLELWAREGKKRKGWTSVHIPNSII